jgi:hypothetical protein
VVERLATRWMVWGSNSAGGMGVCVVCCTVKRKGATRDNQDKK